MKKKSIFLNNKWGGKIKLKIKYEIVKVDNEEKFQINLLGEIVNKQHTKNLCNMCNYVLLFQQKKTIE